MDISKAQQISGWMTDEELQFLAETASKCTTIYEVGSYHGRSTRAMADNMKRGKIYCIDPWDGINYNNKNQVIFICDLNDRNLFYINLMDHIKSGRVIMCPSKFHEWIPSEEDRPDLIFIDGDHRYESVKKDINHAMQFHPRIIAGHDYLMGWDGVIKAVDERFGNEKGVTGSIWWTML